MNTRRNDPDFNEPSLSANLAFVERLRAVGKRRGYAPGAVAVAWTLLHSAISVHASQSRWTMWSLRRQFTSLNRTSRRLKLSSNSPGGANENWFCRSGHHG